MSNDAPDPEIYHGYSVDDEDQPQDTGDSSAPRRDVEELDEGYSPPEKWSAGQGWGNTPWEEQRGESLEQRLAQEQPDEPTDEQAEIYDSGETGSERAGRIVEPDEGAREDTDAQAVAQDVGIDGAGASAEEAAVHIVDDNGDMP
jgi:hypothetical protein